MEVERNENRSRTFIELRVVREGCELRTDNTRRRQRLLDDVVVVAAKVSVEWVCLCDDNARAPLSAQDGFQQADDRCAGATVVLPPSRSVRSGAS